MVSKTHHGNGLTNLLLLSISITRNIITITKTLETMTLLKKFMDLPTMTRASCPSHGEELSKHTQQMASRTHHGNGLTSLLLSSTSIISSIMLKTLVIMTSMKKSMGLPIPIRVSFHFHGEESMKHTPRTASRTHPGNGSIRPNITISITNTNITKTLVIMILSKKFMVLPTMTRASYHSHGEELRKHTQ